MNLLFTMCARAGSKGVKSKNIRDFLGVPICGYSIAAIELFVEKYAANYARIDIALNTDSKDLKQQFDKTGITYMYVPRTEALAGDFAAKADVICDTLRKVEQMNLCQYDFVVDIDLTSPLRTEEDINNCIKKMGNDSNANVCYSVTNSRRQPHFNLVLENSKGYLETAIKSNYKTRQEAPKSYDMNASIYVYRRAPLLKTEEKDVFSGDCLGSVMMDTAVLDIDSEDDYELMQVLAEYFVTKNSLIKRVFEKGKEYFSE